ncbi:glycoside hydrolase family 12 protein [Lachnoclostridium sp.]|uniref:glycoside hydrolase family 12 protein n=1 Tax=Lachnoclostridium sp. TaxID=2028282 RepID=UPI00289B1BB8|nr:glycosyl hydrolase [Lachnoclostridium sp.]
MKNKFKILVSLVFSFILFLNITFTAYAATWSSADQWATWSNGGYTIYNNVWGSGAGYQSIWANSYSNWGVWAQHPNTGGIKSYPNVTKSIGKTLSSIKTLQSSFNVTRPSSGAYVSAYDIWTNGYSYEIMLWMNSYGSVAPISYKWDASGKPVPVYTNLSLGGHTWNVYQGSNGSNPVYSFVRTSSTNSGTVDILAILNWINGKGWFSGTQTINLVQFGFEITSSSAGSDFMCNSYSVTSN